MSKSLIIYGAGGGGRELIYLLSLEKDENVRWEVKGFVDDTDNMQIESVTGIPVLGGLEYLADYKGNLALTIFDYPRARRNLVKKLKKNRNILFPSLISSTSITAPDFQKGEGCIVNTFNYISINVSAGNFVLINGGTQVGHDTKIGSFTTIYSGVTIGGGALLGDCCLIGSGAVILPKVKIGSNSVVGGGAVVVNDVPESVVVAGNPARIIRKIGEREPSP